MTVHTATALQNNWLLRSSNGMQMQREADNHSFCMGALNVGIYHLAALLSCTTPKAAKHWLCSQLWYTMKVTQDPVTLSPNFYSGLSTSALKVVQDRKASCFNNSACYVEISSLSVEMERGEGDEKGCVRLIYMQILCPQFQSTLQEKTIS